MTGSNFYTYVLNIFNRTDKSTEVYNAVTDAVMQFKRKFTAEDYKEETYSTGIDTADEYTLSLPSDFHILVGDVVLIDNTGGSKPLTKRTKATFDILYPDREETDVDTGVPQNYCIYGNQIFIGPVPDSTSYEYQISYTTEDGTEVTSSTSDVPFSTQYRDVLRAKTLENLYFGLGNDKEAGKWRNIAREGIQDIVAINDYNTGAPDAVNYTDF